MKKLNAEASKGGAGGEGTPDSGGAAADEGDVESESGIEMDKLRQGIRTAVSSIARFKTRWAHVSAFCLVPLFVFCLKRITIGSRPALK